MRNRWILALAASLLVSLSAAPAAAQTGAGVFDQPFHGNLFQPLLSERWSLSGGMNLSATNNTLSVVDMVAIGEIGTDFRFSDLFLIAGLVPEGEGIQLASQNEARVTLGILPTPLGIFGVTAGANAYVTGSVPDDVAGLLRDGITTTDGRITLDLSDLGGTALAYGDVGVLGLFNLPLPLPGIRLRAGAGAHYLHSIGYAEVGFAGDGTGSSSFTIGHDGITAEIDAQAPVEIINTGQTGFATDFFASAHVGSSLYLGALVRQIGSLEVLEGEKAVTKMTFSGESFGDFFEQLDSLQTDTIAGGEPRSITLPGVLRLEASYQLGILGVGAAYEQFMGEEFDLESAITGRAELRLLPFLPIRVGAATGGVYGPGLRGGFGLDFNALRFDLEAATRGAINPNDATGVRLRSAFTLRF